MSLLNKRLTPKLMPLKCCKYEEYKKWEKYYILKYKTYKQTNYDINGEGKKSNPTNLGILNKKILSKKIVKYNLNGDFICEYSSLRNAEKLTGIDHGNISKVCNKFFKHTKGYIFKYKNDKRKINKIINPNATKKCVLLLNSLGEIINEYKSISDAAKDNNIDASQISRICNNKTKKKKQFKFKNYENIK